MSGDQLETARAAGPIYIGGLDRTGKTTMRAFLASHPNIAIPAVGSNMWTYFYRRFGDLAEPANLERCLAEMLRYKHITFLEPDEQLIRREFAAGPPTYAHLFSLFLIDHARREGKPRWGAQTGLIERYAPLLFEAYPDLRIIHMVRDPRDRYEASLAAWPNGKGRAGGAAARFVYSCRLAARHQRRFGTDRYRVVRFEDLVRDPEATVVGTCEFVGEDFDPSMMTMPAAPQLKDKLGPDGNGDAATDLLSLDFIGRHRDHIAPTEVEFIQLAAGRAMRRQGYQTTPVELSLTERARALAVDHPSQLARYASWRSVEALQQRMPEVFGRKPGRRMLVDPQPVGSES